jgi:hypothetical protein
MPTMLLIYDATREPFSRPSFMCITLCDAEQEEITASGR